jgi:hypothetical protein
LKTRLHQHWKSGALALSLALAAPVVAGGCASAPPPPAAQPVDPAVALDADPLALVPPGAVALANLDNRSFNASGTPAAELAALGETNFAVGQELGLAPSRDIDRSVFAVYVGATSDVVAIATGRFDQARMQAAAASHVPSRLGTPWTALPYAGRTLYTSSNVAFAPITDHTLAAGSESAVRRVLDRIATWGREPHPKREIADWMLQTLEAPGSAFEFAADVGSIPPQAMHGFTLQGAANGLSRLGVLVDFHPPGLNIAATLTYADPPHATAGADAARQLGVVLTSAGKLGLGPQIQNLTIAADGPNMTTKFALDDQGVRLAVATITKMLAATSPRPPG